MCLEMMFMHILDFFMDFSFANIWSKWKKRKEKKKKKNLRDH